MVRRTESRRRALSELILRKLIFMSMLTLLPAFLADSVQRRKVQVDLQSQILRKRFQILAGFFIRKMDYRSAFAALEMDVLLAVIFLLGCLVNKSVGDERLVFYELAVFGHLVQISVDRRFVHAHTVGCQKIRKLPGCKSAVHFRLDELRNQICCLSVIGLLQHSCNLQQSGFFVKGLFEFFSVEFSPWIL